MDLLFERNYRNLIAWCRRHCPREWGDPEDFVHQAYLRCRQRWSLERSSAGREAAYFYRALKWVVADAARERQKLPRGTGDVHTHVVDPLRELVIRETLGILTPKERAICRAYLQGQPEQQVRRQLQLSPGALAAHLSRARRKLCQALAIPWQKKSEPLLDPKAAGRPDFL